MLVSSIWDMHHYLVVLPLPQYTPSAEGPLHLWVKGLVRQNEHIYNSSSALYLCMLGLCWYGATIAW